MFMKKMKHGLVWLFIIILMIQSVSCSNHQKEGKNTTNQQKLEPQMGADGNAGNDETLVYSRSDNIALKTEIDFQELGVEYFDDVVELYQDEALNNKIYCKYDWDKKQHKLTLLPPDYPILNVSTVFASKSSQREFEHSDYYFFDKGKNKDWGNLGTMYLVKWRDLQTGNKLEQPDVQEVCIKGELDTPKNFQFEVSEYGNAALSWESVSGAEMYLIVEAVYRTDEISGFYESCSILAETTDTKWQSETEDDYMNSEFHTYSVSEDDKYYYGVIAIGKEGTSMISSVISKDEIAKRLPYCKEDNGTKGEDYFVRYANRIELLSRYQWIQLCDRTMAQRLIRYQIDEAEIVSIQDLGGESKEMLRIPYTVEGTDFDGSFYVEDFERDTYQEDLKVLQERQEILNSKMSGMLTNVQITVKSEVDKSKKQETENDIHKENGETGQENNRRNDNLNVSASDLTVTTELSRYLASCLLQGEDYILISDAHKKLSKGTLMDAFYEAYFQNPLIPAVKEVELSESLEELFVIYEEDKEKREEKQQKVLEQVKFVAQELIEDGMTDTDKVLAINSYLCDLVTYDEQAAQQSLDGTDAFSDSMTPYGALIQHKGVCTAYAGAFQLLAKAMGLESIVVTGTLSGNRNHVWNKVKIDGKWCIVDVTSNDEQDMKNVFLNVSDDVAGLMLKEDKRYLCDESIGKYLADTDEFEYYHLADQYYEKDKIAEALIQELTYNKKAVLRTDATLNNEEFQAIVNQVMDDMDQMMLQGYYQLGVIYLERK